MRELVVEIELLRETLNRIIEEAELDRNDIVADGIREHLIASHKRVDLMDIRYTCNS